MGQLTFTTAEVDNVLNQIADPITTYAYISTPADTTMTLANRWYFFNGTFTNQLASNVTGVTDGIQVDKDGRVEVEFMTNGTSSATAQLKIGVVKNGTFVGGLLDAGDDILPGSEGSYEADTAGSTNGFGNMHSLWAGDVEDGDILTLVISSDTAGAVFTPDSGATSMHPFAKPV